STQNYWALPNNNRSLHDLIIRKASLADSIVDFGINRNQRISEDFLKMNYSGSIVKIGELDSSFAYREIKAEGLRISEGRIKSLKRRRWEQLTPQEELTLIKKGFLFVRWRAGTSPIGVLQNRILNLVNNENLAPLRAGSPANFILLRKRKPRYAVVNGFLIDCAAQETPIGMNTIGY
ncbi:MAG: hypothetical protein ACQUHE_18405, partial [Bacteroidia bacterium]